MLFDVTHKYVHIVVDAQLVLEVASSVGDQKSIASFDKLIVVWVCVCLTINTLLYNLQRNFSDVKALKHSLVFDVRLSIVLVNIENHEFLDLCFQFVYRKWSSCFTSVEA